MKFKNPQIEEGCMPHSLERRRESRAVCELPLLAIVDGASMQIAPIIFYGRYGKSRRSHCGRFSFSLTNKFNRRPTMAVQRKGKGPRVQREKRVEVERVTGKRDVRTLLTSGIP
ncbi:hypothetical protein DBV15_09141 [Temnothorax longispinosus]|uniref:Uncharacterized protein n=1 Tax=Temnothorax longispinosus TaxID=300112 RepID=A0A4S2KFV4_9HYME|nr:hypothetical protein DBV15_09141 [Temnothorax longispinosus]